MNKLAFLEKLREELNGLPKEDINERLNFYSEIIDDKIEDGIPEEQAVLEIGTAEEIAKQILISTPISKLIKRKIKPKRRISAWEITLIILGFPLWFPLLVSFFAVLFALYISLWAIVVSVWAAFVSVIACAFAGVLAGIGFVLFNNTVSGVFLISAGLVCAGLSIFIFFGCKAITKGMALLTKSILLAIKKGFTKKEAVK